MGVSETPLNPGTNVTKKRWPVEGYLKKEDRSDIWMKPKLRY
jgi:hypothetical protein